MKSTQIIALVSIMALAGGCTTTSGPGPTASGAPSADALDIAVLDQIPVARFMVKPVYPFSLQKRGIAGEAVIAFIVDTDGNVRDPWIMRATREEFGVAAWNAVSQWKFRPGQKGGRNVNVRMTVPVVFNLTEVPPPAAPAKNAAQPSGSPDSL